MANESAKFMKNAYIGWTATVGLHYPESYDPSKVQELNRKAKQKKIKQGTYKREMITMRMIIPFTFICDKCGEFNMLGKKLSFKMEYVKGEDYLGVRVYRFYGNCTTCTSKYTFKNDPKSSGYILESGGRRAYEHGGDVETAEGQIKDKEEEAKEDAMEKLNLAAQQAAQQMKEQEAIEDLQHISRREMRREENIQNALDMLYEQGAQRDDEDDRAEAEDLEAYFDEMESVKTQERDFQSAQLDLKLREANASGVRMGVDGMMGSFGASSFGASSFGGGASSSSSSSSFLRPGAPFHTEEGPAIPGGLGGGDHDERDGGDSPPLAKRRKFSGHDDSGPSGGKAKESLLGDLTAANLTKKGTSSEADKLKSGQGLSTFSKQNLKSKFGIKVVKKGEVAAKKKGVFSEEEDSSESEPRKTLGKGGAAGSSGGPAGGVAVAKKAAAPAAPAPAAPNLMAGFGDSSDSE